MPKRTVVRNNKNSSGADSSRRRNGRDASSPRRRPPRLNHPRSDLEEAIRRYVDLFDFAPVAYVNFDRTSRIAETNLAAIQLLGRSRHLLIGRPLTVFVLSEDRPHFFDHLRRCRNAKGELIETDLRMRNARNEILFVRLVSKPAASSLRDGAAIYQTAIVDLTERKRQEAQMERQAKLIELSFEPIIVWDFDDGIVAWNAGAETLYGYSGKEAIGRPMHKLLKTVRPMSLPEFRKILERDGRWEGDLRHTTKDGREIFAHSRHQLVEIDGRRLVLETIWDITEWKHAEAALRESEERFRQFAENTADVFWIIDAQTGQLDYLNPAYESMFGEAREPIMRDASHWTELIHPEDRHRGADMLPRLKAGEKVTIDYRIVRPNDGTIRWIRDSGFPIRDERGEIARVAGVLQDITDDKLKTDALRESEERFRLLIEGAPDYAMFLLDPGNRIIYWSTGAERVFGWSAKEALGRSGELVFTPEDRARNQEQKEMQIACEKGKASDRRWHLRKDGSRVWIDGVMRRLDDKEGNLRGFAKIGRDATELHLATRKLHRSHRELERRVGERTAEISAANKELRAEIAGREQAEQELLLISEREKRRIGEDLHDSLCQELAAAAFFLQTSANKIEQANPREAKALSNAARIVNDNVGLARDLARGLHPVELTASGLTTALRELVFRSCQDKMKCQFKCPNPIRISDEAVALSLYRIAQEAMTNASKNGKAKKVVISLVRSRERVVLSIQDDGKGFSTRRRSKGMGLHLMRYRANSIGARLTVKSAIGKGTTITCSVPAN